MSREREEYCVFGGKFGVALGAEFVHASTLPVIAAAKINRAVDERVPNFMVILFLDVSPEGFLCLCRIIRAIGNRLEWLSLVVCPDCFRELVGRCGALVLNFVARSNQILQSPAEILQKLIMDSLFILMMHVWGCSVSS